MLEGIYWRHPQRTWQPEAAGCACGMLIPLVDSEVTNHATCAPLATVTLPIAGLPDRLESLKRLLTAERMARIKIARLKLAIEKMRRELYGRRSERGRKFLDRIEIELEDLEATAAEDEIAAEMAATKVGCAATLVPAYARLGPQTQGSFLKPFEFLARERDRGFS
jgi:Transposase C of IS166 homeodomain